MKGLRYIVFFSFIFLPTTQYAQVNTLYLMHEVPQTLQMNPAIGYHCKTFVQVPIISGFMLNTGTNLVSYKNLISYNAINDQYKINYSNLRNNAGRNNRLFFSNKVNLLGAGIELERHYISANIGMKTFFAFGAPRDFFFATDGNWDLQNDAPRDLNLSNSFANAISLLGLSVAASTAYSRDLRIGARLAFLKGVINSHTRKSHFELDTEDNPIILSAYSEAIQRSSFPMKIAYNQDGYVRDINLDNSFTDIPGNFIFNKNMGIATDVGVVYDYTENIQFTASALDIGFVRWKSNINNFNEEGSFTFDGFDLSDYAGNTGDVDLIESLADSIQDNFVYGSDQEGYITLLPVKIYTGATYSINERMSGGATLRMDLHNWNIYPSLTFSVIYRPMQKLSGVFSYSLMNRSFNNFGAGLVGGGENIQFYMMTDILPLQLARDRATGILIPYNLRAVNISFGLNILFNCRDKDKKQFGRSKTIRFCPAYD